MAYFYLPILVIYLSNTVSLFQASILVSVKDVVVFLLEVPTGFVADSYGRKRSMQFGLLFCIISLGIFSLFKSFILFFVAEIFFGVSEALISGADDAWLYDDLDFLGVKDHYPVVLQKISQFQYFVLLLAYIIGPNLYAINSVLPFKISLLFLILAFVICASCKEYTHIQEHINSDQKLKHTFLRITDTDSRCWAILIEGNLIIGIIMALYSYIIPLLLQRTVETSRIGFIYSGCMVIISFLVGFSGKIKSYLKNSYHFMPPVLAIISACLCLIWFRSVSVVIFMVAIRLACGWFSIMYNIDLNNAITDSKIRATMTSIGNGVCSIITALLTIIYGMLADRIPLVYLCICSGILMLVIVMIYSGIKTSLDKS